MKALRYTLVTVSVELFPCDVIFVHRDAERASYSSRIMEINRAVRNAQNEGPIPPHVCVVPVRMQESWLLFDSDAIRRAAGNPNGTQQFELPNRYLIEHLPNPKSVLHDLLRDASGLSQRRRRQFTAPRAAQRLATLIEDFSPLRQLPAFVRLESDVRKIALDFGC